MLSMSTRNVFQIINMPDRNLQPSEMTSQQELRRILVRLDFSVSNLLLLLSTLEKL